MKLRERIIAPRDPENTPSNQERTVRFSWPRQKDRRKLDHELRLLMSRGDLVIVKGDRYCIPGDVDLTTGVIRFRKWIRLCNTR